MGAHTLEKPPSSLQTYVLSKIDREDLRYRWSKLRELDMSIWPILLLMAGVLVMSLVAAIGAVFSVFIPGGDGVDTLRPGQAAVAGAGLPKSPVTPATDPRKTKPAPTALRITMAVKGYTHPVVVQRITPKRMQVRVSALNVRGVPTTRVNKPVQAPWPKGKRVTITAVAWAQNPAVDGKTKWAFTSEKRWMWYGGLKVAGPLAKATVNLAGKGPIRLKDLPILSHRASDDYMPANHPRTAAERSAAIAKAQAIGKQLLARWGWSGQWNCYNSLIKSESGWKWWIDNPISSAYGIPQSLPGTKMRSAGADWRTNPVTQIIWGLDYIKKRFGTPCAAWSWKKSHGWY
jgi:hypothetical protein